MSLLRREITTGRLRRHSLSRTLLMAAGVILAVRSVVSQPGTAAPFDFSRTLRVDYRHSGGPGGEALALDRSVAEGPWPGSRTRLIDDTGLGKYLYQIVERRSNRIIYSRGFASIYGEWETTPDSRTGARTFHESVRLPWPTVPIRVVLNKRDRENRFQPFWSADVNPGDQPADPVVQQSPGRLWTIVDSGPPDGKVDVLLLSEGYGREQLPEFHADASRLVNALFAIEPFRSRKSDFNVRALDLPGSRLGVEFNIFGLPRYALTYDNRAVRDAASAAGYEVIEILVNDERYGGGGIFNLQSTVAAANPASEHVFVHEFAHNFAALADEYVGNVPYEPSAGNLEPWEANLTTMRDPAGLKWRDLVEPGTPLPTPLTLAGKVGAFEGAGYEKTGLYRAEADCIMFSRNRAEFCRVCQRAIGRVIDSYSR